MAIMQEKQQKIVFEIEWRFHDSVTFGTQLVTVHLPAWGIDSHLSVFGNQLVFRVHVENKSFQQCLIIP